MSQDDLHERLQELRRQLEESNKVDDHIKDMLGSLMEDVLKLSSHPAGGSVRKESVKQQLEEQATDFESQHPKLAATIRQVMDLLAKMGI